MGLSILNSIVRLGLILDREFKLFMKRTAGVAQLLKHLVTNLETEGSNPGATLQKEKLEEKKWCSGELSF